MMHNPPFDELTRQHYSSVVASAFKLVRTRSLAEDLAHDAFLRASLKFDRFTPGTNFRAWMQTLLRNTHVDRLRRAKRESRGLDGLPPPREVVEAELPSAALETAIRALPRKQREAIDLELRGLTREAIARELGTKRSNVDLLIYRAKERLRRAI